MTTTTPAMAAARATLPNTGHRTGLYVVTGPSWIGGSGAWGWIAGFIGASLPEIVVAPSLRQSCPHNANCKCTWRKDFRSAWRDGHGHICVGTSARHASGKSALSRTTSIMIQTTAWMRILCARHSLECSGPLLTGDSIRACVASQGDIWLYLSSE